MDKKDHQLSNKFNFSSGLQKMGVAPFQIMLGVFMTVSGFMVALITAMYTREDTSLLLDGGRTVGVGFKNLFWEGPKEMVLSFKKQKDETGSSQPLPPPSPGPQP